MPVRAARKASLAALRTILATLDVRALRDCLAGHRERIAFGHVRAAVLAGCYRAELRRRGATPIAEGRPA